MSETEEDNHRKHSNYPMWNKKEHVSKYWYKKLKLKEVPLSTKKHYK